MADNVEPTEMPQLVTRPNVDLVAAGTWQLSTGEATFTAEDLAAAIEAQACPAIGHPVIKLGHVDPRFDGEPAVGFVANMAPGRERPEDRRRPDRHPGLAGLGAGLAPTRTGRSRATRTSPARSATSTRSCSTGLALLGVTPPGVGVLSSLKDVAALYGVAAAVDRTYGQGDRWNLSLPNRPGNTRGSNHAGAGHGRWRHRRRRPPRLLRGRQHADDVLDHGDAARPAAAHRVRRRDRQPVPGAGDDQRAATSTFGDPVQVQVEYQDVAGSSPEEAGRIHGSRRSWRTAAESRSGLARHAAATSQREHDPEHRRGGRPGGCSNADHRRRGPARGAAREARQGPEDEELTGAEILAALAARHDEPRPTQAAAQVSAAAAAEQGMVRVDAAQWAPSSRTSQAGREARAEQRTAAPRHA